MHQVWIAEKAWVSLSAAWDPAQFPLPALVQHFPQPALNLGPDPSVHWAHAKWKAQLLPSGIKTHLISCHRQDLRRKELFPCRHANHTKGLAWLSGMKPCLLKSPFLFLPLLSCCQGYFSLALVFPAVISCWPLTGSTQLIKFGCDLSLLAACSFGLIYFPLCCRIQFFKGDEFCV